MPIIQKIIFGSPGTGKSHKVDKDILPNILKVDKSENKISIVFHPEYTYGDFMGKLVPHTDKGKVQYNFYPGHFLQALAKSYKNYITSHDQDGIKLSEPENVALVIDEINRGNSASIFGTVFQLLDRDPDGWSSYAINITELEFLSLLELIGVRITYDRDGNIDSYKLSPFGEFKKVETLQKKIPYLKIDLENKKIKIPPNFHLLGTMNTSDNSIYYMDSAFKRRWEWEFVDIEPIAPDYFDAIDSQINLDDASWKKFVKAVNSFLKGHSDKIRKIEDKQIGYYFIKSRPIKPEEIRNKLMFFLWDSVFSNDKKPLLELVNEARVEDDKIDRKQFVTFGDFVSFFKDFYRAIEKRMN
jgi:5-methylcytosine-specific restriction endonuclease McrBC GTP-binding regulatory subunit McrB